MADEALFPAPPSPKPKKTFGPVYQGVCRQIRALLAEEKIDKQRDAGTIAQARSLAESIDRVSGHGGKYQASGMQLAALHERLDGLLERLTPERAEADPFQELLDSLNDDDQETRTDGRSPAPHREV
ncbi:hypothetical protein PZ938_07625 [Luteipulveratus sp. YIM 133132]|uniref:hypothetical protein n=1 Tax=Luteipulveratus flavus TaxID=3031728 RepID=UPI0023AEEC9A|nr:hypothetical protein [Luteipulveratus sp. YIM 133132]MDE9365471.1 hypothetical protein [Luteipulveratus sp. YIM 133132]